MAYGEWDWDALTTWDTDLLAEWGLQVPTFDEEKEIEEAAFEENNQYFLNIRCENETHAQELYEEFIQKGLDVKIVT